MFDRLIWQPDRMMLEDLVFRLEYIKSDEWVRPDHFVFYKKKNLIDQYENYFSKIPGFKPTNILELGISDSGSIAFWYETFHPSKMVAIDLLDR